MLRCRSRWSRSTIDHINQVNYMKQILLTAAALLSLAVSVARADDAKPDDTNQPPRTHIDTTVVGDAVGSPGSSDQPANLDNDHHFVAGAPELLSVTKRLNLTAKQQARVNAAIENADAGAAVLIKHEQDLQQMIRATTPEDPLYAKLIADESVNASHWNENRESLRHEVLDILTPAQRSRFDELMAARQN